MGQDVPWIHHASETIVDLMIKMSWGLVVAIVFVGVLNFVPREKVNQVMGHKNGLKGILRATLAGVVLDLCNHGILLIAMKLYERGISVGQLIAFLIASPWNSLSMTLILWSLIGLPLTLAFLLLSCVIAVVTGLIFDACEKRGILPSNPNRIPPEGYDRKVPWFVVDWSRGVGVVVWETIVSSTVESKMILRWIFFGVVLTAAVKAVLSPEIFADYFGPDIAGLALTLLAATVIEVCSEGSSPLAAELATTAKAPGNAFTFLMAGVSTDYTEILSLKETTKSWKIALFLPLITLPQILVLGLILNRVFL